jgi:RNA polymerase sigma factor for flagellar operon FliA
VNTAAAEYRAVQRASAGDCVSRHADLVRRIAHHLAARLPASVEIDDLIQSGMIGLIEASRSYDPEQGASFETYASIRIRGSMIDEIRRGDWVPRSVHRRARQAAATVREIEQRTGRAAVRELEQASGRAATPQEVAARLEMPLPEYMKLLEDASRGQVLSLDSHVEDHGEVHAPSGGLSPQQTLERSDFGRELAGAIGQLPEREQLVLSLYYEQELNLKEIGAVLGVSESRVCQIHGQAVLRLRGRLGGYESRDAGLDSA